MSSKTQKQKQSSSFILKVYLSAYNAISAIGWSYILIFTIIHLFNLDNKSDAISPPIPKTASSVISRLSSYFLSKSLKFTAPATIEARIPPFLQPVYRRSLTTFSRVGTETAFVQSFAFLEIIHVLLRWVRSSLPTTLAQVSSRLFLVWGITEQFPEARINPLFSSMVLAWSMTEVVRYSFYSVNFFGMNPYSLLYLRYTTFYVLYPLGALSEAFLIFSTLPSTLKQFQWFDYVRAVLFAIWWPGLYKLYSYMIAKRRDILLNSPKTLKTS